MKIQTVRNVQYPYHPDAGYRTLSPSLQLSLPPGLRDSCKCLWKWTEMQSSGYRFQQPSAKNSFHLINHQIPCVFSSSVPSACGRYSHPCTIFRSDGFHMHLFPKSWQPPYNPASPPDLPSDIGQPVQNPRHLHRFQSP